MQKETTRSAGSSFGRKGSRERDGTLDVPALEDHEDDDAEEGFVEWDRRLHRWGVGATTAGLDKEDDDGETLKWNPLLKATRGISLNGGSMNGQLINKPFTREDGNLFSATEKEIRYPGMPVALFGRYRPVRVVGEGTFSQIVEAVDMYATLNDRREPGGWSTHSKEEDEEVEDEGTRTTVAIKVMKTVPGDIEGTLLHTKIGQREASWLHRIGRLDRGESSGVVNLKSTFSIEGHFCLVMELTGPSLDRIINAQADSDRKSAGTTPRPPFAIPELRTITAQVLASLAFLHNNEIIHADIKPENVVFQSDFENYERDIREKHNFWVKLIDFGNALSMGDAEEQYKKAAQGDCSLDVQSIPYRAPEVQWRRPFGTKIDMWSLGCVLFELYTGNMLFDLSKVVHSEDHAKEGKSELRAMLGERLVLMMVDLLGSNALALRDVLPRNSNECQQKRDKKDVKTEEKREQQADTKQRKDEQKDDEVRLLLEEEEEGPPPPSIRIQDDKEHGNKRGRKRRKAKRKGEPASNQASANTKQVKSPGEREKHQSDIAGDKNASPAGVVQSPRGDTSLTKRKRRDRALAGMLQVNEKGELFFNKKRKLANGDEETFVKIQRPVPTMGGTNGFVPSQEGLRTAMQVTCNAGLDKDGGEAFLSFKKGDTVHILERASEGYWRCEFAGQRGLAAVADLEIRPFWETAPDPLEKQKGQQQDAPRRHVETYRRSQYNHTHKKLMAVLKTGDHLFVDFLQRLLEYNPARRLSPQEALLHPFLASVFPFLSVFTNQVYDLSIAALRDRACSEARRDAGFEAYLAGAPSPAEVKRSNEGAEEEAKKEAQKKLEHEYALKLKSEKARLKKKKKDSIREKDKVMTLDRINIRKMCEKDMAWQLKMDTQQAEKKIRQELAKENAALQKEVEGLRARSGGLARTPEPAAAELKKRLKVKAHRQKIKIIEKYQKDMREEREAARLVKEELNKGTERNRAEVDMVVERCHREYEERMRATQKENEEKWEAQRVKLFRECETKMQQEVRRLKEGWEEEKSDAAAGWEKELQKREGQWNRKEKQLEKNSKVQQKTFDKKNKELDDEVQKLKLQLEKLEVAKKQKKQKKKMVMKQAKERQGNMQDALDEALVKQKVLETELVEKGQQTASMQGTIIELKRRLGAIGNECSTLHRTSRAAEERDKSLQAIANSLQNAIKDSQAARGRDHATLTRLLGLAKNDEKADDSSAGRGGL